MSHEMRQYWEPAARRIEDCGTRHFPAHGDQRIYGAGTLVIIIDRQGRLLGADIVESSGNQRLDAEMRRFVSASAPFGRTPERVNKNDEVRASKIGVVSKFNFTRDNKAPAAVLVDLAPNERCRWPNRR